MSVLVQIFSNERCMPVENVSADEHSRDFKEAVSQMVERAGNAVSFISENIAIIPMAGDLRLVVIGWVMTSDDVDYNKGKSIVDLPISHICHAPCPDMVGTANATAETKKRAIFLLGKLREKHGIKKPEKTKAKPLNYRCTDGQCLEKWEQNQWAHKSHSKH